MNEKPIIFFDGVCNLCNSAIDFFIRIDKKKKLKYAPLQGSTSKDLLSSKLIEDLDTVVLFYEDKVYLRSRAILKTMQIIGFPFSLIGIFRIIPHQITDFLYDQIAKSRYKIFGKKDSCRLPTKEEKELFLD